MLFLDVITNSNHKFSIQNSVQKNSVFQKTSFYFSFCTQFQFFCENSESSPIRYLIHNHVQVSRLIRYIIINQRECLLGIKKSCTDLTKGALSNNIQVLILGCIKIRIRKISNGLLGDWM